MNQIVSTHPINSKRSSSNIEAQQYEPSVKKASCISSSESQIAPRVSSGNKKMFTCAPMGDFFAKCGLISRGQQVFEDFFIQEDKFDYYPLIKTTQIIEKTPFSSNYVDYCSSMNLSVQAKCLSSLCLSGSEQSSSSKNQQQQQLLLETRAREESSETSINCDGEEEEEEEDQIEGGHKCNFLTEQIDPSAQIIIQGCESAQPIARENQNLTQGHDIEQDQQYNYIEEDYATLQEYSEIKVIEIVKYD
ncbi:hypothetical protein ABPG72_003246 [Tetrahymena utriculariae]